MNAVENIHNIEFLANQMFVLEKLKQWQKLKPDNLDLKDVKFLLDPLNFKTNITTKEPTIIFNGKKIEIKTVKTNLSLKALIRDEFVIEDLQVSTKKIKLNDLVLLIRSFNNSTELLILNNFIKKGFLTADIKIKFDDTGKIKDDYLISGFVKNAKFDMLNKYNLKNLGFKFDISKKIYSLTQIKTDFNDINLSSPLIEVLKKKDLSLIRGKIFTKEKSFSKGQLNNIFVNSLEILNIEKTRFASENDISFSINNKFRFNDLNIKSIINLNQLVVTNNFFDFKPYIPNLDKKISFKDHKILFNYKKDKLDINGEGKILVKNKFDFVNYNIKKSNDNFTFNTKLNLKNSELLFNLLDYKKKENLDALLLIKGNLKASDEIKFDLVSLTENDNKFLFKELYLDKNFKILSIDSFNLNFQNNKKIHNQLYLKKDKSNYTIEGKKFDATNLINIIMDKEDDDTSIFKDFNSNIEIKIKKTFIDEVNFFNNLIGIIDYKNNKINNLDLRSTFLNNKTFNYSIKTNDQQEKITKIFTDYPKPLVKRYDFVKGFEEGYLEFFSVKKDGISNSVLIIDNFKVREVPIFAKLLSLASLQGIADLLTGEGIRFTDFEMNFSSQKNLTKIEEMYAIGPAVSILMDGYIQPNELVSLRGTLVPATTINRSIASLPLLGKILIGEKTGEGVFGVSFKIKGPPKNLKTTVNPIKTLTPRFITRTLEKIKKD